MKKILAMILALVMCFSLVACGGGNDDAAQADDGATKIKIGMVGFADTTEEETVLELTEMKDTVPGNTVADYRLENR